MRNGSGDAQEPTHALSQVCTHAAIENTALTLLEQLFSPTGHVHLLTQAIERWLVGAADRLVRFPACHRFFEGARYQLHIYPKTAFHFGGSSFPNIRKCGRCWRFPASEFVHFSLISSKPQIIAMGLHFKSAQRHAFLEKCRRPLPLMSILAESV